MSKEEAKTILKHVYNEDPMAFKQDFDKILRKHILGKMEDERQTILSSINKDAENETTDETTTDEPVTTDEPAKDTPVVDNSNPTDEQKTEIVNQHLTMKDTTNKSE